MKWSWRLGQVAGIEIFAHWTLLILIISIIAGHVVVGASVGTAVEGFAFVVAVFGCVLLHELGHALAAQRYGICTLDITLLPIGGVARLERLPEEPRQELWVALAGPAVNVLIAAVIFLAIEVIYGFASLHNVVMPGERLLAKLMWTNLVLVGFNLLPAFPMDGGRALRALLAHRLNYVRATQIATSAGQMMAIFFAVLGFFFNWLLVFIALFVYVGAGQEARMVQTHALLRSGNTRTAMMTRFRVLSPDNTLAAAANELLAGPQEDFPVLDRSRLVGVLPRNTLIKALAQTGPDASVDTVMQRDCPVAQETDTLEQTFETMRSGGCSSLPVLRDGHVVGVVTMENIEDWMLVRSALDHSHSLADVEELLQV